MFFCCFDDAQAEINTSRSTSNRSFDSIVVDSPSKARRLSAGFLDDTIESFKKTLQKNPNLAKERISSNCCTSCLKVSSYFVKACCHGYKEKADLLLATMNTEKFEKNRLENLLEKLCRREEVVPAALVMLDINDATLYKTAEKNLTKAFEQTALKSESFTSFGDCLQKGSVEEMQEMLSKNPKLALEREASGCLGKVTQPCQTCDKLTSYFVKVTAHGQREKGKVFLNYMPRDTLNALEQMVAKLYQTESDPEAYQSLSAEEKSIYIQAANALKVYGSIEI